MAVMPDATHLHLREVPAFIAYVVISLVSATVAALLHHPELACIFPALILVALFWTIGPTVLLVFLFAAFSIGSPSWAFGWDTLMFPLLFMVWLVRARPLSPPMEGRNVPRTLALMNGAWIALVLLLHGYDFDATYAYSVGLRLISYYCMFVMIGDLCARMSRRQIMLVMRSAWAFSIVVTSIAVFQSVVLRQSRINSILEVHHSHLGNYGVLAAVLAGICYAWARSTPGKLVAIGSVLLACVSVVLSETRADILGLGVGLVCFGLFRGIRGVLAMAVLILAMMQTGIVTSTLEKTKALTFQEAAVDPSASAVLETRYDPSSVDRVLVWIGILDALTQADAGRLTAGVGPGNFGAAMRPYMTLHAAYMRVPTGTINGAHNNILHIIVELGIAGFLLFAGFLVSLLYRLFKLRRHRDGRIRLALHGVAAGTIALMVSAFTQETFYAQPAMGNLYAMFMCVVALFFCLASSQADDASHRAGR